jgi:hypothetical protein
MTKKKKKIVDLPVDLVEYIFRFLSRKDCVIYALVDNRNGYRYFGISYKDNLRNMLFVNYIYTNYSCHICRKIMLFDPQITKYPYQSVGNICETCSGGISNNYEDEYTCRKCNKSQNGRCYSYLTHDNTTMCSNCIQTLRSTTTNECCICHMIGEQVGLLTPHQHGVGLEVCKTETEEQGDKILIIRNMCRSCRRQTIIK